MRPAALSWVAVVVGSLRPRARRLRSAIRAPPLQPKATTAAQLSGGAPPPPSPRPRHTTLAGGSAPRLPKSPWPRHDSAQPPPEANRAPGAPAGSGRSSPHGAAQPSRPPPPSLSRGPPNHLATPRSRAPKLPTAIARRGAAERPMFEGYFFARADLEALRAAVEEAE